MKGTKAPDGTVVYRQRLVGSFSQSLNLRRFPFDHDTFRVKVMMSWMVFWIDPVNASSQISVAVTSMLTLIAYRFAVGSDIPKLPYLTRLDAFILSSTILVFLSLIEVMITTAFAGRSRIELARNIDRHCRWAFPLVFATVTGIVFLR